MSVALPEVKLPFSVYFEQSQSVSSGAQSFILPDRFRNVSSSYGDFRYLLPGGVSMVQVAWAGAEQVSVLATNRWTASGSALYLAGIIPAGASGTARVLTFPYSSTSNGGLLHVAADTEFSQATRDRGFSVAVTIYPTSEFVKEA